VWSARSCPSTSAQDGVLADALIANNAVGIALTKRALRTNVDAPGADALDLHSLNQALITATGAAREALTSFQRT
jgi:hypothetical protein